MAKPYAVPNEVQGTLAAVFVHGTDNSLTLAAIGLFNADGGYIRVKTVDDAHWALYEYTGVAGAVLNGLAACTLGLVETDAAYTFPIGSIVERNWMGEDAVDRTGNTSASEAFAFFVE